MSSANQPISANDRPSDGGKDARCASVNCPAYGKHLKKCRRCSGPVVWRDANGQTHGTARSCHACPNNGLRLPVCWAGCPGANTGFQTDGQSIVTLGALDDPDGFLQDERAQSLSHDDYAGDTVIDALPGEPDDPRHAYDETVTARLSNEAETACRVVLSNILSQDETDLRIFYWLYNGKKPVDVAVKVCISKQAVFKRMRNMSAQSAWLRAFMKSLNLTTSSGGGANRGKRKGHLFQADLFDESMMRDLMTAHGALGIAKKRHAK